MGDTFLPQNFKKYSGTTSTLVALVAPVLYVEY